MWWRAGAVPPSAGPREPEMRPKFAEVLYLTSRGWLVFAPVGQRDEKLERTGACKTCQIFRVDKDL